MSSAWPQPTRADHRRFVEIERWTPVSSTHHETFERELTDGRVLRTRISRPPDRRHTYGTAMWSHILRDQLDVTPAEFWRCVTDGVLPNRGDTSGPVDPAVAIPVEVARLLAERVGLPEAVIARMTRAEAIARLNEFWSSGG